jgi:hypothetical protein
MTKISQYSTDVNITGNDKWIGSDAQNFLITKNFTPNNLANYFNGSNVIDIGTSIRYRYQTLLPGEAREQGTISFETEIGPQVNFSAITTFLIAKNTLKGNTVTQYLDFLVDGKVLLSKASNINIFGYYKITSIEPWIPNTNFFVVEVDFLSGNGFIYEDLDYLVSLVDKVQDIPPPVWGSITGDIEDQTDLIDYISSQITTPTLQSVTDVGNTTTNDIIVSKETGASYIHVENNNNALTLQVDSTFGTYIELNDANNNNYGSLSCGELLMTSGNSSAIVQLNAEYFSMQSAGSKPYIALNGSDGILTGSVAIKTDLIDDDYIQQLPNASGTIALTSDITTPTLQQVTDEGNITTDSIILRDSVGTDIVIESSNGGNSIQLSKDSASLSIQLTEGGTIPDPILEGSILLNDDRGTTSIYSDVIQIGAIDIRPAEINFNDSNSSINFIGTGFGYAQLRSDLITSATTLEQQLPNKSGTFAMLDDIPTAGVTSVGLTMPSAFSVTNSPITSSGDIAVTAVGSASQYIRGDGQLATLPSNASGGSAVSYYLNGGTAASVVTYFQMSKIAVIGTGVDFSLAGNGLISQWLTDVADPNRLEIPAGNWNFEMYMSASSSGGTPAFYVELLKYDGVTFTTIANSSAVPEAITSGTLIDLYLTSLAIPYTALTITDRLAVRVYIVNSTGGRTITMHTQDSHLCQIITNFAGGIAALNGLSANTQYFDVGTGATNFNISSSGDTHTFNLLFNIRRNANNSSNNNINYNGYAVTGSAESSAVWTITRLTIAASGSITVATATNVAWTNRESATYI